MIIGVSSSIVVLLIILGIIARKWIVKWRGSKRTSEKGVELSLVNSAAGPKSVQCPNFSRLNREMPTGQVYLDLNTGVGTIVKGNENSEQPRELRVTAHFFRPCCLGIRSCMRND